MCRRLSKNLADHKWTHFTKVSKSVDSLKLNGISITNPIDLSNEFKNHFSTIDLKLASEISSSTEEDCNYLKYLSGSDIDKSFQLSIIIVTQLCSALNNVDVSKGRGTHAIFFSRRQRNGWNFVPLPAREWKSQVSHIARGNAIVIWRVRQPLPKVNIV